MYNASFLNLLSHLVLKAKEILNVQGQKENSDLVLESDSKLFKRFLQRFITLLSLRGSKLVGKLTFTVRKPLASLTDRQVLKLLRKKV